MTRGLDEPWLRGTLTEVDALRRQVLHSLEMAGEDVEKWCAGLSDTEMNARPVGVAPVAFHLRHIVRSLDRLLTYAEGRQLSAEQLASMKEELDGGATRAGIFDELNVFKPFIFKLGCDFLCTFMGYFKKDCSAGLKKVMSKM